MKENQLYVKYAVVVFLLDFRHSSTQSKRLYKDICFFLKSLNFIFLSFLKNIISMVVLLTCMSLHYVYVVLMETRKCH